MYSKLMALFGRFLFETNDARRMSKQNCDTSDLSIITDIHYISDDMPEHMLDIYRPKGAPDELPVIVNIHGGGLFASYKTVNEWFNYEWARMGYTVVSLSYRRIPDTTLIHQVEDVMAALHYIREHKDMYGLNLDRCYLTGDSAGALLSLFALSIESSEKLQKVFGIEPSGISFKAAAFISIMLDTKRKGLLSFLEKVVCNAGDIGKPYLPFILNPSALLSEAHLPPLYLVTSDEDLIQKDTLKFDRLLTESDVEHRLMNFPKGKHQKLIHVFSVQYPLRTESREVYDEIDRFFKFY